MGKHKKQIYGQATGFVSHDVGDVNEEKIFAKYCDRIVNHSTGIDSIPKLPDKFVILGHTDNGIYE